MNVQRLILAIALISAVTSVVQAEPRQEIITPSNLSDGNYETIFDVSTEYSPHNVPRNSESELLPHFRLIPPIGSEFGEVGGFGDIPSHQPQFPAWSESRLGDFGPVSESTVLPSQTRLFDATDYGLSVSAEFPAIDQYDNDLDSDESRGVVARFFNANPYAFSVLMFGIAFCLAVGMWWAGRHGVHSRR